MSKSKKMTSAQATALYYIELDGGLIRTNGQESPFTTTRGRPVHPVTAQWLIDQKRDKPRPSGRGRIAPL